MCNSEDRQACQPYRTPQEPLVARNASVRWAGGWPLRIPGAQPLCCWVAFISRSVDTDSSDDSINYQLWGYSLLQDFSFQDGVWILQHLKNLSQQAQSFSYFSADFLSIASTTATKGTKGGADGPGLWRWVVVCIERGAHLLEQQRGERERYEQYNNIKSHLIFVWHLTAAEAV